MHINQLVKELNEETDLFPQINTNHSLGHIANIDDILQPNEEVEFSSNLMAIYTMTMDEVEALEAQTHPTRKQAFKDRKYDWTLAKAQLESFSVVTEVIRNSPQTLEKEAKAQSILGHIQVLNKEIDSLEAKMKKLAASDDGTSVTFPMPTEYGTTNFMTKDELGEVMKFRPGKNRLLHVWISCLRKGRNISKPPSTKSPLSEEGWKEALAAHLADTPLTIFNECQELPLQQILARLAKIYEKRENIRDLQLRFDRAKRDPKDTFECALEKLKMLQEKICEQADYADKQSHISRNIKHKLMTDESFLPRNVQITLERLEHELKRRCEPFDFETEACRIMSYQDTNITPTVDDITGELYSLQFKRPREEDGDQPPPKRANVMKPADRGNSSNINSSSGSQHYKSPPTVTKSSNNSSPQGKKIVKARRVLGNQQNNLSLPKQQKQQVDKLPYPPKGDRFSPQKSRIFTPRQSGQPQSNGNKPSSSYNSQQQRQFQLPTQKVQPQYRAPPTDGNNFKYQPFQHNEGSNFGTNPNNIPIYENNRTSNRGNGQSFNKNYNNSYRQTQRPANQNYRQNTQNSFSNNQRPNFGGARNQNRNNRKYPRRDKNSYTRVYDDKFIDTTTTFDGTDTVVTTYTSGNICKNPKCEHVQVHLPRLCPHKNQNL